MANKFEPKSGKAQWEIVFDVLNKKNIGDVATYEEILLALGPDFPRLSLSSVVWTAIRKIRTEKRTFENVRGVGWRMVDSNEHMRLAKKQQIKSKRRLAEAVSIAASADLTRLNPEERRAQRDQELHLRKLHDRVSRKEQRDDAGDEAITEKDKAAIQKGVDQLKELLGRYGIKDDQWLPTS